jgi:alpha-tubulin suppressor-like RCC1 family protein
MPLKEVVAIATSGDHSTGAVEKCDRGGLGTKFRMGSPPVHVGGSTNGYVTFGGVQLSNVVGFTTGYGHSLALRRDGTVVGWGNNYFGQAVGSRRSRRSRHTGR